MSLEKIEKVRKALRQGEISLRGVVKQEDAKFLEVILSSARERVFEAVSAREISNRVHPEVCLNIYRYFIRAALRYKRKIDPHFQLSDDATNLFESELQDLQTLFEQHGLKANAKLLEKAMVYGGFDYWQEFFRAEADFLKLNPSMIQRAILYEKQDARKFLSQAKIIIDDILCEEEFSYLKERPWMITHAVFNSPKNPRKFLRESKETAQDILNEEEFSSCTFLTVLDIVIRYSSDPRKALTAYRLKYPPKKSKKPKELKEAQKS